MNETIGTILSNLRERTGMSLSEVAKAAEYKGPSSVQAYFDPAYDVKPLRGSVALRLARAMHGKGDPPVEMEDILKLGHIAGFDITRGWEGHSGWPQKPPPQSNDVPVFPSSPSGDMIFYDVDGGRHSIETVSLMLGQTIDTIPRPHMLSASSRVYVTHISGHSMEPRYRQGDPVFVEPLRPASVGDDVIAQFHYGLGEQSSISGLIKTLVERTPDHIRLEQYHPKATFRVEINKVISLHKIIPWREVLGL